MRYAIVGNGVAGINAANTLRHRDESASISLVSSERDHFFSRTALMYVACGQLSEACVEPYERDYYEKMGFTRVRERASGIDAANHQLIFDSGNRLEYDRLLLACGSVAVAPPWPGSDIGGVGHFVTWDDLTWLRREMTQAKRAVVVGGGLIGIEVCEVLIQAGIETHFLIREKKFWPIALSAAESDVVVPHMKHHGCHVHLGTEMAEAVATNGRLSSVRLSDGSQLDCDLLVVAIGVRPQTDWLRETGIALDDRGGIIVDDQLKTNLRDVYAAGDCSSVVWFNGVQRPEQLWYTSRDQGVVAGHNMVGDAREYRRGTFYNSAKFFDIEYTTAGLVNFHVEGEVDWWQHEPGTYYTTRITYLPAENNRVIGFNGLGRRWDHSILVQWIEERRTLEWMLRHLGEANFDEEFMPRFAATVPVEGGR